MKKTCSGGDGCRCQICGATAMHQGIFGVGSHKWSAIFSHQLYSAYVYTSMARTCAWDIFNLGVSRRMFADCCAFLGAVRRYIADDSWRRNIEIKFQCMHLHFYLCPDALAKYDDYSRTSPVIRPTTHARWLCPGDAQIWTSRKYR